MDRAPCSAVLFLVSPSKPATGWWFVPAVVSRHRDLPRAVAVPVQFPEAAVWSSCLCVWVFFVFFCFDKQAVLLCLHWPDSCRAVTRGFLGTAPDASQPHGKLCTARSQKQQSGAFRSPSGLSGHKAGATWGWDSPCSDQPCCWGWRKQI